MLPILLMILLSAGVLSQPVQQNCRTNEKEFRECLRKSKEDVYSGEEDMLTNLEKVFDKCGVYQSDCNLQKKLAAMFNKHIGSEIEFPKEMSEEASKCFNELHGGPATIECTKTAHYDEHGFRRMEALSLGSDQAARKMRCLAERAKESEMCNSEGVEIMDLMAKRLEKAEVVEDISGFYGFVLTENQF